MLIPFRERASHWYLPNGKPFYEVPNKSKPGQMRPVNARDANTAKAVPSVTTILRVVPKPGLQHWMNNRLVMAAIKLPRMTSETDEDFAARVVEEAEKPSEEAKEGGINIHGAIDDWIRRGVIPLATSPEYPAVKAYIPWHEKHIGIVTATEQSFTCATYGGRVDLIAHWLEDDSIVIIDFKTQGTVGGKFKVYDEMMLQLVAYSDGLGYSQARLMNVIFSTTEPGLMQSFDWTPGREELRDYWGTCFKMWKYQNRNSYRYEPVAA